MLDKGLKFAPPRSLSKFRTYMDMHKYVRKLNIKRYLASNPVRSDLGVGSQFQHSGLSNAPLFNPPGVMAPSIRVFRDVVLRDLEDIKVKKFRMQKDLEVGLDSLCNNKSLVIHPADKGGGIVVLDRCDYLKEIHRILGDSETYIPLNRDPVFV